MMKGKSAMQWLGYMFKAENSETFEPECTFWPMGALKSLFWVGMSFLMAAGINQLT